MNKKYAWIDINSVYGEYLDDWSANKNNAEIAQTRDYAEHYKIVRTWEISI
jgi:hypothetical protein